MMLCLQLKDIKQGKKKNQRKRQTPLKLKSSVIFYLPYLVIVF